MLESKKSIGFTLVELLAVIVVLAIIALISVPIITGVIDKAKEGALKDSAYGIIEAGELYYASNLKEGIEETEFTCSKNKCINEEKEIEYKGDIDTGIIKLYTDGKITVCIEKDNYGAYKMANEKEVTVEKGNCNDDYTVDAYVSKKEYEKIKNELNDLKTLLNETNIEASDILEGKKAYVNGEIVIGTNKKAKIILLGSAKTYDIKTLYPELYGSLTADNFLIVPTTSVTDSKSYWTGGYSSNDNTNMLYTTIKTNFNKTYTNGTLTITSNLGVTVVQHYATAGVRSTNDYNVESPFNVYLIIQ